MKPIRVVVAVTVALALQTTLTRFPLLARVSFDLVQVAVIYLALSQGPVTGVLAGTIGGVAQDALSGGILGIGGLANTVVGFVAGLAGRQFIVGQAVPRAVLFFSAGLLHAAVFSGMYALVGARPVALTWPAVAALAGANTALGLALFEVVEFLPGAVERRRARRGGGMKVAPRPRD